MESSDDEPAQNIRQRVVVKKNCQENITFQHVHIDTATFKLPRYFGGTLDSKLKNKQVLVKKDLSSVCRELSRSIRETGTNHPHPDSIRFVVDKFINRYPAVVFNEKDITTTSVSCKTISNF